MLRIRPLTLALAAMLILSFLLLAGLSSRRALAQTPPSPTATAVTAGSVTLTPGNSFLGCAGQTQITVAVRTGDGPPPPDGTPVAIATNFGAISPMSGTTSGGNFVAVLTAPSMSGAALVTATSLGATGTVAISVNCRGAPAQLAFPATVCTSSSAITTFSWNSSGAGAQWLDLTLFDNGFAPFTFIGAGPLDASVNQITWNGLLPGRPHFWRINTVTSAGWITSSTGAFVPCGGPEVRGVSYGCSGSGTAAVTFLWAPASPSGFSNWLDLTVFNNDFFPGTFIGAGPLPGPEQQLTWIGILANVPHYWRLNSLMSWGWDPSATGSFFAAC